MTALEDERAAHWVCVKMRDDALAEVKRLRAFLMELRNHFDDAAGQHMVKRIDAAIEQERK